MEHGDYPSASRLFAQAVSLNPNKPEYLAALLVAREHAITALLQESSQVRTADPAKSKRLLQQARDLDSSNPRVQQHASGGLSASGAATPRAEQIASSIALQPNASVHNYHLRADTRALVARVVADYGLRAAFDPDLPTKSLRLDVDTVNATRAMRLLSLLSETLFVPLDEHTVLVAANTVDNRRRYERLVEQTFYLPGYQADQLKDFVSVAQQLLDVRQVSVAPLGGSLTVRGPADRVAAVEALFTDLVHGPSEVLLDVKLYSIDKSHVRNLGVVLPQSLNAYSVAAQAQSIVSQNSTLISQLIASGVIPANTSPVELAAYLVFVAGLGGSSSLLQNSFLLLGGGLTTAAISAGNFPSINLALSQSEARSLDDVQLRVSDQQRAIVRSGTRYPIQTSLFSDIASSAAGSLAGTTVNGVSLSSLLASYLGSSTIGSSAVIPQVQYEDLGVTATLTPRIQRNRDVSMKLEVKVSALAGTSINGIPILDSRQFVSDLTVRDGETVLMISNTSHNENVAISGLPGLTDVPGFQSATNRNRSEQDSNLVLLITPHIVRQEHTSGVGPYLPLAPRPGDD